MSFDKRKIDGFVRALVLAALIAAIGVGVTGCMNRSDGNSGGVNGGKITQPSPSPDYMPQGTAVNERMNAAPSAGRFDWTKSAADVEKQIARISEISEARLVVEGDTALVAVKFNSAYQGEMTERIREMVAAEVMKADPEITTVAVTADDEDVKTVGELADRLLSGATMEELKQDINEIVRNATTLR